MADTTDETVEAVAPKPISDRVDWLLTALKANGLAVVLIDPTPAMIAAARVACRDDLDPTDEELAALYRAMIAAAEAK